MTREMELFIQTVLQDRIKDAHVIVRFGAARDRTRRFDTDHDGFTIVFTIDKVYMTDPREVDHMWCELKAWVKGWNEYDARRALADPADLPDNVAYDETTPFPQGLPEGLYE